MAPLVTLLSVSSLLLGVGRRLDQPTRRVPVALRGGLAAMFLLTGVSHFVGKRDELISMVPPLLPAPGVLVSVTGAAELLGALALLRGRAAGPAAAALTVLLVAMFPANVHHGLEHDDLTWASQLVPRTVIQVLFVAATSIVAFDRLRPRGAGCRKPGAVTRRIFSRDLNGS